MKSRSKSTKLKEKVKGSLGRIIVITGARQTGKTTLVKTLFPNYAYVSVEDPVLRMQYKALTAAQWNKIYPLAILDEVQKEPALIESIKSVYDQFEEPRYVLLGSSQLMLMKQVKESLAGRCLIEEIYPLTLPELQSEHFEDIVPLSVFQQVLKTHEMPDLIPGLHLHERHPQIIASFHHYLHFGGYPALVSGQLSDADRREWLRNYQRTYLERDIRDLADFRNLEPFIRIQKTSALLTGQLINYSALAREAGVLSNTAQRFIHYLELSYQAILLPPWHRNSLKRLSKSPKIHFLDPGVQRTITGKLEGELTGHEFESALIAEMYKQAKNIDFSGSFYHLRTLDGREVDLLIETTLGYYAIEIKNSTQINASDARHLKGLEEFLDKPVLQQIILSQDPQVKQFGNNILAVPAPLFLS
jgi:predicted AAA+ superfamily ATPase